MDESDSNESIAVFPFYAQRGSDAGLICALQDITWPQNQNKLLFSLIKLNFLTLDITHLFSIEVLTPCYIIFFLFYLLKTILAFFIILEWKYSKMY